MRSVFRLPLSLLALLIAGSFALISGSFAIANGQQKLNGSYTTYVDDKAGNVETYTVNINADGSLQSVADIQVGPTVNHVVTTATKNGPVKFELTVGDKGRLSTDFAAGVAKIAITGQPDSTMKTGATVVLENGVWHQFIFLLRQYDGARGGSQTFKAFLPTLTMEFSLDVERIDTPSFTVKGNKTATEHYRATTSMGLVFEVWTDGDRLPLLVSIPLLGMKVIRQGAEGLADSVFGEAAVKATEQAFTSEEVTFSSGDVKLAGTLTIPKKGTSPYPAAVIISGSGPQDRDGAFGVFNLYKLVAERLSNSGVAVLRADDRGVGKSVMPRRQSSYRDLINDSRAAFEYLAQRRDIDKNHIALVGHSEGAETALTIAAEDSRVAAIALLAGPSHPMDKGVVEQSIYQAALQQVIDPGDQTQLARDAVPLIQRFEALSREKAPANGAIDQTTWFREHLASDPSALARRVKCPVLILNGERDALVLAHNAIDLAQTLTASGNKQVRLRIFPNLTHLFTPVSVDNPEKATEVSPEMLRTLQTWAVTVLVSKTP